MLQYRRIIITGHWKGQMPIKVHGLSCRLVVQRTTPSHL